MCPSTHFPAAMFMNPTGGRWEKANTSTVYVSGSMDSRERMACQIISLVLQISLHSDIVMINITMFLQTLDM